MPQAKSNIPTIAERLDKPQQLNSTVRSYSYSEYVEKRPDYVGFDKYGAGASWGNLARALDGFYTSFNRQANDVFLPQWKERGEALGQEDFNAHSETEGYTKNRLAFKEFVEKHPEMANANPWVKVGYEKARLNTLALEMENGLQQAMIDNGIYNEEDESKAKLFAQSYIKHFKDEAGLTGYEDSVLLAKAFGSKEAQIYDGAIDQYNKVQNAEQQKKLANGVHDEMVSILTSTNMTDEQKNIAIQEALNRGREHGLLDSNAEALVPEVIKATYAITKSESLLDKCKTLEVNGRKLINWKGVPEWISAEKTRIAQREAAQAQKAEIAHQKFMRNQVAKAATEIGMMFADGKVTDRNQAIDTWCKENGVTLDPASRYDLEYKVEQQRQHIASRPESLIDAQEQIDDISKSSQNLAEEEEKLKEAYIRNPHPEIRRRLNVVREKMGKEGEQGIKLTEQLDKQATKALEEITDKVTKATIKTYQADDIDKKVAVNYTEYYTDKELSRKAFDMYKTEVNELEEKWMAEHPNSKLLPSDKKAIAAQAVETISTRIDKGIFADEPCLKRENLIRRQTLTDPNATPTITSTDIYRGLPPERVKKVEEWRKGMDTFLSSQYNTTNYKSVDSIENLVDIVKMSDEGITDFKPEYLIKYAKGKSPAKGGSYDQNTGVMTINFDPANDDSNKNLIAMSGIKVKSNADLQIKGLSSSTELVSRQDMIVARELYQDITGKQLVVVGTGRNRLVTQGLLVNTLKSSGMSDEQTLKFMLDLQKLTTPEAKKDDSANKKLRNSRRR